MTGRITPKAIGPANRADATSCTPRPKPNVRAIAATREFRASSVTAGRRQRKTSRRKQARQLRAMTNPAPASQTNSQYKTAIGSARESFAAAADWLEVLASCATGKAGVDAGETVWG